MKDSPLFHIRGWQGLSFIYSFALYTEVLYIVHFWRCKSALCRDAILFEPSKGHVLSDVLVHIHVHVHVYKYHVVIIMSTCVHTAVCIITCIHVPVRNQVEMVWSFLAHSPGRLQCRCWISNSYINQ